MAYSHVFGPVMSGRLGRSLGLDLLGVKICTLDCVYCEVGATRVLTRERRAYVPARRLLDELARWKKEAGGLALDYVTLGGSGEPCLNREMGDILAGARELFPNTPTAVLTNSTLLDDPEVRAALALADVVLPSLDTLVPGEFTAVNRPHAELSLENLARGLLDFRAGFAGRLYLEVLLVAGMNDTRDNLEALTDFVPRLRPDRVDVVTMTRPGTLPTARPLDPAALARWREALTAHPGGSGSGPGQGAATARTAPGPADVPAGTPGSRNSACADQGERGGLRFAELKDMVASSLSRRPQTAPQLAQALGVPQRLVDSALAELAAAGRIAEIDKEPGSQGFFGPVER
jgi:wyosine [tRNA(Phe)-imidazoG37] synthetase (radical SAM superfamily)